MRFDTGPGPAPAGSPGYRHVRTVPLQRVVRASSLTEQAPVSNFPLPRLYESFNLWQHGGIPNPRTHTLLKVGFARSRSI